MGIITVPTSLGRCEDEMKQLELPGTSVSCEDDDDSNDGNSFHYSHTWRKVLLTAFHLFSVQGSEVETLGYEGCHHRRQLCPARGRHTGVRAGEQGTRIEQCSGQLAERKYI